MTDSPPEPRAIQKVLVTGATGFIGHHFCQRLVGAGYAVIGLVRSLPDEAKALPGVTYATGDVQDASSLASETFASVDAVIHLVGIIAEVRGKGQTFTRIHVEGTRNILDAAKASERSPLFIYLSAQGASLKAKSEYARTKAEAERLVEESGLPYTLFRPSIVLGQEAAFLKQIEGLIRRPPFTPFPVPFIPVPGKGKNRFQPVHVDDLATCILGALTLPESQGHRFEIGGSDTVTFNELIEAVERQLGVKKTLFHAPVPLLFVAAAVLEALLPKPPITVDQLYILQNDNVCDNTAVQEVFGISPLSFEETLARCYATEQTSEAGAGEV